MKQVEVTILGQSYLLACPEGGEALLEAAVAAVDREMSSIRDAGKVKVKVRERIAVLAALNLAYCIAESSSRHEDKSSGEPPPHLDHMQASAARRAAAAQLESLITRLDSALDDTPPPASVLHTIETP